MTRRLLAIVRADFLIRFRRPSTLVLFLLLSALPYLWIPDPSTGRALFRIDHARALYNSAATGIGTAMLATMFIGLAGFYVVSNAVARDVRTRCGSLIASTTITSGEYLFGKFLANTAFLSAFTAGFMGTAMAMQLVRGEAPLEPWTFAQQYLVLLPPMIVLVAILAIVFESIPPLSGRIGDVVYFFVWCAVMVSSAMLVMKGDSHWYLDPTGMAFVIDHIHKAQHTGSVSIGAGSFDASKPLVVLTGLPMDIRAVAQRLASMFVPLILLPAGLLTFHRFDPERTRSAGPGARVGWAARVDALVKPLIRRIAAMPTIGAVSADAMLTFAVHPATAVLAVGIVVAGLLSAGSTPVTFAATALLIADIASRDIRSGTTALTWAAPRLRESFVGWKFASSMLITGVLLAIPFARTVVAHPPRALAFVIGTLFVTAAATSLGIISSNPKTFIVLFLTFWYVVVNDHGATPALDFGGWYGTVPARAMAVYALLAVSLLAAAHLVHRVRFARE